jgi:Kelch motif
VRGRLGAAVSVLCWLLAACSGTDPDPPEAGPDAGPQVSTPATGTPGWTVVPARLAALPTARTEVAGAAWQGRIVVVGGLTEAGVASDRVDVYDLATDRWDAGPRLPVGLHHVGLAVAGDRVYVAGGYHNPTPGAAWQAQSRVISLGPAESSWRDEPPLAEPRGGLALAAVGDRLVAVGGTGIDTGGVLRRTEVLVPGDGGWRAGPDLTEPRDHLGATASGSRVYAIAGRQGSLESNLATVESWDPQAGSGDGWRAEPRLGDTRGGTSASEVAGRPCVAGGEEPQGTIASVECLAGGRWERVAVLDEPRHGLAVVGLGDRLHVIGGGARPGLFVSTAHEVLEFS